MYRVLMALQDLLGAQGYQVRENPAAAHHIGNRPGAAGAAGPIPVSICGPLSRGSPG